MASTGTRDELLAATLESSDSPERASWWSRVFLPVVLPLLVVATILVADSLEGPKTAYVGVIAVVPMLAAVFGTPRQTALVAAIAWLSAFTFGHLASDGNVTAQQVRLIIIAISGVAAIFAARQRVARERRLQIAERAQALVEQMRHDATTDLLTGALNRRGILAALEDADRSTAWTIAVADCDNFKGINDRFGHLAGDRYLRTAAMRLNRALAEGDIVGRWGGDEFLVAVPLPVDQAMTVLRRVCDQTTREPVVTSSGEEMSISMTFGIAQWHQDEDLDDVLRRADEAMYAGKDTGCWSTGDCASINCARSRA